MMGTKQPLQWLRLALILFCLWSLACAQTYENKVIGVSDGDTLTVLMSGRQVKIRLAEIDAPEKRQPFGQRAKRYCGDMVSCEEARFYLNQCGVRSLDRDGDGVPCKSLCK